MLKRTTFLILLLQHILFAWNLQSSFAKETGLESLSENIYEERLNRISETEFPYLQENIYLDYTGSGLFQKTQLDKFRDELSTHLYGNAHSLSPCSISTEIRVDEVRDMVLSHFNVSRKDYSVIFTSGSTGALKMIGENFPWTKGSKYYYLFQNHNSVLGIRQYALLKGASFKSLKEEEIEDEFPPLAPFETFPFHIPRFENKSQDATTYNLFGFPAEENFSGVKFPLEWISTVSSRSSSKEKWLVLLDAAAFVPVAGLDLSKWKPDFVVISFYKIFGFPTGLGALIIKNSAAQILQKIYFGGGTVVQALPHLPFHAFRDKEIYQKFEDGTIPFLDIMALTYGFEAIDQLGIRSIEQHVFSLSQYLYKELKALKHSNGQSVCMIYGRHHLEDSTKQGPIISFNIMRKDGTFIGYHDIEHKAARKNIQIRTGCMCNPGACILSLQLDPQQIMELASKKQMGCGVGDDLLDGKPTGAIRVSLGYPTTRAHIDSFLKFMKENYVE